MQIGEVAKRSGLPAPTIRYYEEQKLVAAAPRSASGYRVYSERVLGELRFIRQAQRLGFSLDEIREILNMGRGGRKPCDKVAALCDTHLEEVERQMSELRAFRRGLLSVKQQAEAGCGLTPDGFCRAILGENQGSRR